MIPGLPWKLIGIGIGALALIALLLTINGWRVERNHLREWQGAVLTATKDASANPKLKAKDVPQQIALLGKAIADLKAGIAHQNAAVNDLAAKSAQAQADAERAILSGKERVRAVEATSARLAASARAGGPSGAAAGICKPSKVLQEQWR